MGVGDGRDGYTRIRIRRSSDLDREQHQQHRKITPIPPYTPQLNPIDAEKHTYHGKSLPSCVSGAAPAAYVRRDVRWKVVRVLVARALGRADLKARKARRGRAIVGVWVSWIRD